MHEMSLAQEILQILEDAAHRENAKRVKSVWLELGALAAVDADAIAFCFDAVTRNTLAEGAQLNIEEIPGRGWCLQCNAPASMVRRDDACPLCGGYRMQVEDGMQMRVRELEIED